MKVILKILTFVLVVMILFPMGIKAVSSLKSTSSSSTSDKSHPYGIVTIEDAFYSDLDYDGFEDDVFAFVSIDLEGATTYTFDYYITLTLPSGISYSYLYVITTNYDILNLNNYFYDHALEQGWYKLDVLIKLHTGGEHIDKDSYEFDPPGGSCCSDPTFTLEEA